MKSAIYFGRIGHIRYSPKPHRFYYKIAYLLLDLDEGPELQNVSRLFSWNNSAWLSYRDVDHGVGGPETFKDFLNSCVIGAGLESSGWRFSVLCLPRVLGYCFNPISIVFCYHEDELACMIYEVDNTFGERVHYVIPITSKRDIIRQRCKKSLYVSPFFEVEGQYNFKLSEPKEQMLAAIDYHHQDNIKMRALFRAVRRPFDANGVRKMLLAHPVLSFKVISFIHFQALRLWLKGLRPLKREKIANGTVILGEEK